MTKFKTKPFIVLMASALAGLAITLLAVRTYSLKKISPQIEAIEVKTEIYTVDKGAYDTAHYIGAINPEDTLNTLEWKD